MSNPYGNYNLQNCKRCKSAEFPKYISKQAEYAANRLNGGKTLFRCLDPGLDQNTQLVPIEEFETHKDEKCYCFKPHAEPLVPCQHA